MYRQRGRATLRRRRPHRLTAFEYAMGTNCESQFLLFQVAGPSASVPPLRSGGAVNRDRVCFAQWVRFIAMAAGVLGVRDIRDAGYEFAEQCVVPYLSPRKMRKMASAACRAGRETINRRYFRRDDFRPGDPPCGGPPPKEGIVHGCCPGTIPGKFTPYGGEEITLLQRTGKQAESLPCDLIATSCGGRDICFGAHCIGEARMPNRAQCTSGRQLT
jgi:hypothetical protein